MKAEPLNVRFRCLVCRQRLVEVEVACAKQPPHRHVRCDLCSTLMNTVKHDWAACIFASAVDGNGDSHDA